MLNLNKEVQRLSAIPKSRLTERELLILGHITTLMIQKFESINDNTIKELKKILEKINVQFEYRS